MAAPLRNKPVDRRRLSRRDRADYNRGGYQSAARKSSRTRRFAGQRIAQLNQRPNTTDQFSRSGDYLGDFKPGIETQQARLRKKGADQKRSEALRPTKISGAKSVPAIE